MSMKLSLNTFVVKIKAAINTAVAWKRSVHLFFVVCL